MDATPTHGQAAGSSPIPWSNPVQIELGPDHWQEQMDRAEQWFGNVLMVQVAFRRLAGETHEKVRMPRIREFLGVIFEQAREHEGRAEELLRRIDREPSAVRELGGRLLARSREALADLLDGAGGGAAGAWKDLHQLHLSSLNALGAFGVAQQLGLALGRPDLVEITLPVQEEKFTHHRQLQELLLDMAPAAILYRMEI